MSNPQRAARLLAQTMQVQLAKQTLPRVRVVVSEALSQTPSFEALQNLPCMGNSSVELTDARGFEGTQQMQSANAVKELAELNKPETAPATAVSVFVVSPLDVLKGRDGAHVTLDAAIQQSLDPGDKVVISLLPVKLDAPSEEEQYFLDSAEVAVKRTLADLTVPVCTSLEALAQHINA